MEEDDYGPGGDRVLYRRVQLAKALRRRASGTHITYELGSRFSRYPRSAGRVLEALGAIVEEACAFATRRHLPAVLELKQARYGVLLTPPHGTIAKSRFGNAKVPPPPPAVSLRETNTAAEREEAERIVEELRRDFARDGFPAFRGRF